MDSGENAAVSFRPETLKRIPLPLEKPIFGPIQQPVNMPWKDSMQPEEQRLTFMKFWEHQLYVMEASLTNLKKLPVANHDESMDFTFNHQKNARIVNFALQSEEFRKIRMTYYDAGVQCQVFNALFYPNPKYNLPLLGIDLLQFNGGKKHLAVIDFQPIQVTEEEHACKYEHLIQPIRDSYPSLKGKMSKRWFDEKQFFSNQMLFARFEDPETIERDLWPAFQQYLQVYLDLIEETPVNTDNMDKVMNRQAAYDIYSAERDPAMHLFKAKFGEQWADSYVHEFLFDQSR